MVVVFSLAASATGGFMLFLYYGFSSLIDPNLPAGERSTEIAKRFLFHDSPTQIVLISVFAFHGFGGAISAAIHLYAFATGRPTKRVAILASIAGGIASSAIFLTYLALLLV